MRAADLGTRLDGLRVGLESLLSCLEAQPFPEPAAMDAAWDEVLRGFEEVREELDLRGAERMTHEEQLADCLRLYAVATGLLVRRREELAGERALCSRAREHLRTLQDRRGGDSCDLRA